MNFYDKCREYSVIVNDGSGVIFQPMTDEYSYVLTAKHNLKGVNSIKRLEGHSLNEIKVFEHNTLDIAIIKINRITNFIGPMKYDREPEDQEKFKQYGFPETRRATDDGILHFDLEYVDRTGHIIKARNIDYSSQAEVIGFSGCGVFKKDGDNALLLGIETRMDAVGSIERHERVQVVSINALDDLIEQYKSELEPLFPPFMDDFSKLIEDTFELNGMIFKREMVRNKLIKYAKKYHSNGIKPLDIEKQFRKKLWVNGHENTDSTNKDLWQMYLEFLTICTLVEDHVYSSVDEIKELSKKRKILFASSNSWVSLVENILLSDLTDVETGGQVFIACEGDQRPTKCKIDERTLLKNDRVSKDDMHIDSGISNPFKDLSYFHIHAIQKDLIENDISFDDATQSDIEERIKDAISSTIKKN